MFQISLLNYLLLGTSFSPLVLITFLFKDQLKSHVYFIPQGGVNVFLKNISIGILIIRTTKKLSDPQMHDILTIWLAHLESVCTLRTPKLEFQSIVPFYPVMGPLITVNSAKLTCLFSWGHCWPLNGWFPWWLFPLLCNGHIGRHHYLKKPLKPRKIGTGQYTNLISLWKWGIVI